MMSEAVWLFLGRYRRTCIVLVCVLVVAAVLEALSVEAGAHEELLARKGHYSLLMASSLA